MRILLGILTVILAIGIVVGLDALIAIPVSWAFNTLTQLHPTYMTVFVVLVFISILYGGINAKSRKK